MSRALILCLMFSSIAFAFQAGFDSSGIVSISPKNGASNARMTDVKFLSDGSFVAVFIYDGDLTLETNNSFELISSDYHKAQVIAFDSHGNILWQQSLPTANQDAVDFELAITPDDEIYVIGTYSEFGQFQPSNLAGSTFVTKYNLGEKQNFEDIYSPAVRSVANPKIVDNSFLLSGTFGATFSLSNAVQLSTTTPSAWLASYGVDSNKVEFALSALSPSPTGTVSISDFTVSSDGRMFVLLTIGGLANGASPILGTVEGPPSPAQSSYCLFGEVNIASDVVDFLPGFVQIYSNAPPNADEGIFGSKILEVNGKLLVAGRAQVSTAADQDVEVTVGGNGSFTFQNSQAFVVAFSLDETGINPEPETTMFLATNCNPEISEISSLSYTTGEPGVLVGGFVTSNLEDSPPITDCSLNSSPPKNLALSKGFGQGFFGYLNINDLSVFEGATTYIVSTATFGLEVGPSIAVRPSNSSQPNTILVADASAGGSILSESIEPTPLKAEGGAASAGFIVLGRSCNCGEGGCDENLVCLCSTGFYGPDCQETCPCDEGFCSTRGGCICKDGFVGELCDLACPVASDGQECGNGVCREDGGAANCLCLADWEGPTCETQVVPSDSSSCDCSTTSGTQTSTTTSSTTTSSTTTSSSTTTTETTSNSPVVSRGAIILGTGVLLVAASLLILHTQG